MIIVIVVAINDFDDDDNDDDDFLMFLKWRFTKLPEILVNVLVSWGWD